MVLGLFDFSGQTMNLQFTQDQKKDQMLKFQAQKSRSHAGGTATLRMLFS